MTHIGTLVYIYYMEHEAVQKQQESLVVAIADAIPRCFETWGLALWVAFTLSKAVDAPIFWVSMTAGWLLIAVLAIRRKIRLGR